MRINRIQISNFKCFEQLNVEFHKDHNLHVIIAPNMIGKSALIKALRIAASTYLRKISPTRANTISNSDHRVIGNNPFTDITRECAIRTNAEVLNWDGKTWDFSDFEWVIYHENLTNTKYSSISVNDLNKAVVRTYDRVIEKKEETLPLLLYVGTEYIHQPRAQTDTLTQDGNALQGYWYCFEDKSMERYVFDWLRLMNDIFEEQEVKENAVSLYGELPGVFLNSFENTIRTIFPDEIIGVQFLKKRTIRKKKDSVDKDENMLTFHFLNNEVRTYEMLSDGYRYLILLVGEMLTRCLLLNKHKGEQAVNETNGVVLIDEFGIHLHPELQMGALKRLQDAFPQIQFILTTHSPLLLNGLKKEQVHILDIDSNNQRIIRHPEQDIIGLGAEGILKDAFGLVSTLDDTSRQWAEHYKQLFLKKNKEGLDTDESDEFKNLERQLSEISLFPEIDNIEIQDPLYKRFKEYWEKSKQSTDQLTDNDIENIIKEINKS